MKAPPFPLSHNSDDVTKTRMDKETRDVIKGPVCWVRGQLSAFAKRVPLGRRRARERDHRRVSRQPTPVPHLPPIHHLTLALTPTFIALYSLPPFPALSFPLHTTLIFANNA